ncbi:hypothetical protein [uncultured Pseudokineococcus sp.]|uniref:hypothetical protein n=1 Tax=uncultured Pseudokineococcus sp. TaxID=1642928 RepID=UPI002620E710|nr:hypothetical protein [uncultured Pseudokineococcus sp.]
MTGTRDLDATLKSLDRTTADAADDGTRAAADLKRILATDPTTTPQQTGLPQRPRARTARRVGVAGGLVAAATTGLLVLPPLLGESSAFASWTAYPTGLSPEQTATAEGDCRDLLAENAPSIGGLRGADVAIAERRGDWTQVVLTGADGFLASCLSTAPAADSFSAGTGEGRPLPSPDELTIRSAGTATLDAGDVSELTGLAGDDVAGVTYPSEDHGDVVATVSSGAWALWFPGDELEDAADPDGIEVEVTYRDGSTATITLLGECNRGMTDQLC